MKMTVRQFGLLAITLVFALTMTACNRSGNNSSAGSETPASAVELDRMIESYGSNSNDIIFSLDKKSSTSFTLAVEGANWNSDISFFHLISVLKFNPVNYESHSRTSNKIITVEVNKGGTVTLESSNMTGFGVITTDGGMRTGYKINPDKNIVSFP